MDITEIPALYRQNHDITQDTFGQLINVARLLARFAGGTLDTARLSASLVNQWLLARKDNGTAAATINGNRTSLLMLWREAHELGFAPPPQKVRTIKVPSTVPTAFTREELVKLIAACASLKGKFRRVPIRRRVYFESLFESAYDTALRLGDLLSIERTWIWPGGYISIVQKKTGHSHRVMLRPSTICRIDECMSDWPGRAHVWPQVANRKHFYEYVRRLVRVAGIRKGTTKWIRRSSASYVEREHPGCGARHLGHRTPGLAEKYYFDPSIVSREHTLPPPLAG
jgi:integrase